MPLELYASYSGGTVSRPIAKILATLSGPGVEFPCAEEPAEVRVFSSSAPYGALIPKTNGQQNTPSSGTWGYSAGIVKLGTPLSDGEIAVAISAGEKLFEQQTTQNNKLNFIANSADEKDRTKVQVLYLKNTDTDKKHIEVTISFQDLLDSVGASANWSSLSLDNTEFSSSLSFAEINPGEVKTFYAKTVVPLNQETMNYRDVYLQIESTEVSTL